MFATGKVTRLEVIDSRGRSYVNSYCKVVEIELQDDERTLKIFVEDTQPKECEKLQQFLREG